MWGGEGRRGGRTSCEAEGTRRGGTGGGGAGGGGRAGVSAIWPCDGNGERGRTSNHRLQQGARMLAWALRMCCQMTGDGARRDGGGEMSEGSDEGTRRGEGAPCTWLEAGTELVASSHGGRPSGQSERRDPGQAIKRRATALKLASLCRRVHGDQGKPLDHRLLISRRTMYGVPLPYRSPSPPPPPPPTTSTCLPQQPPSNDRASSSSTKITELSEDSPPPPPTEPSLVDFLVHNPLALLVDHGRCFDLVASLLLVCEGILCFAIVNYVPCACPPPLDPFSPPPDSRQRTRHRDRLLDLPPASRRFPRRRARLQPHQGRLWSRIARPTPLASLSRHRVRRTDLRPPAPQTATLPCTSTPTQPCRG